MSTTPTLSNGNKAADGNDAHRYHSHPQHEQRPKTFVAPDGRRCHVASCPRTAHTLRKELEGLHPDGNFDCFVHGSPEHVSGRLRKASHLDTVDPLPD
jgi:hypothetical protein